MLRGLLLFTATAHGGGREASSREGEQAQTSVKGDALWNQICAAIIWLLHDTIFWTEPTLRKITCSEIGCTILCIRITTHIVVVNWGLGKRNRNPHAKEQ